MRRFFVDKVPNMRDIGGYSVENNKIVKFGKIIRSNLITDLDIEDIKEIKKMKFTTIIDLRSNEELEKKKGIFVENPDFKYKHIAINGNGRLPKNEDEIIETYMEMLEGKQQIKEIFEILSEENYGIIYYCNAGKDRTGVITALILKLLGVNNQDIVVDYIASSIFLEKELKDFAKEMNTKEILKIITQKPKTMFDLLNNIQEQYNSIETYIKSCGIREEQIKIIKEKYIQNI